MNLGKHVKEAQLAKGHVFVAGHARRETMLEDHYHFALSRNPDGEYWITSSFGEHFIRDEENNERGKLLQFSRPISLEEAISWLEKELCWTVAAGDSHYVKWVSFSLDRAEIRRLMGGMTIRASAYPFIARLLYGRHGFGPTTSQQIREDQIPHSKIHFTDMPPDDKCRDIVPLVV